MKCPLVNFEMSMGLAWLWAACILKLRAVLLCCWKICMACLVMELVGSWVELGFRVGMEAFGWALIGSCSLESGVLWCSQVLDLHILPLVFSLILKVASRLIHPYSSSDKTSMLMEKRLSTMRDTQKCLLCYMEKRRGRSEIEVTRRTRGGIKRGENNLASNQFPMFSPQPGTPREVHRFIQSKEEEGRR